MADTTPMTIHLDAELKKRLDALCQAEGYTLSGFIRAAIRERLDRLPQAKEPVRAAG